MDLKEYKAGVEAILFAVGEPISTSRIANSLGIEQMVVERLMMSIKDDLSEKDRGVTLLQIEDKWQLSTKSEFGEYVKTALDTGRNVPLSQAALEILAIIAYNQPITRSFIEQIRGVDPSSSMQKLMSKGLIEEAGRLDLPGKPISFKTTDVFLRTFGLSSIKNLPALHLQKDDIDLELESTVEDTQEIGLDNTEISE